jgi:serine/threonine protein kinase
VCRTDFRTAEGQIVGTPAYMAPEQISSGEISPQIHLYATGLIAYELIAGRHPFDGTDAPMALLMHHVNSEPPPLAELRPDLSPGVAEWVHAMLAKEASARPAGAVEAWDRLEGVVSDALGPRWRRDATLGELAALVEVRTSTSSERSGILSLGLPSGAPAAGRHVVYYRSEPERHEPEVDKDEPPCPRWPVLGALLGAALLVAIALIL